MDPKDARIQRQIHELGFNYADAAPKHLGDKIARSPNVDELGDFYLMAGATMIGIMYSVFYKAKGQEDADGWLAKMFACIPTMVRSKGVPVVLAINATARPLDVHPEDDEKRKPGLVGKPPGKCTCAPVPAGLCMPCLERMKRTMKTVIGGITGYLNTMGDLMKGLEKGCRACDLQYIDTALASVIEEGIPDGPASGAEFGDQLAHFLYQMAHQMGVKELPLTEKAWADQRKASN